MSNREYGLAVAVDFAMDLMAGSFDRDSLRRLFSLYRGWGVNRIDWGYTGPHAAGYHSRFNAYQGTHENACKTYEALGEFVPAVAQIAHELGMTCHAVFKPFDRGFNVPYFRPRNAAEARDGIQDEIGGGVRRAWRSYLEFQDRRMERNPCALPDDAETLRIARIRLESDSGKPHALTSENLRIEVSPDNDTYRPYSGPVRFQEKLWRGRHVIELSGLAIAERYVALVTPFREEEGAFANTLNRLVRLYDDQNGDIPFTYGLESNADRFHNWTSRRRHLGAKMAGNVWTAGYIFDASGESLYDGFLKIRRRALDGKPGHLALAKGKSRYVVALSPSYREVQDYWLRGIQDCLDAGVDGVDIRIDNHARSHEWEAYGFEPPVTRACRKRWGADPRREPCSLPRLRAIRAEHFTDFLSRASRLVRRQGRRFHTHVLGFLMRRRTGDRFMGMHWEWDKWLDKHLLDAVTMKGMSPVWPEDGKRLFDAVNRRARWAGADVWYCTNFNVLGGRAEWQQQFPKIWRDSVEAGHAGMVLYESAQLARKRGRGFHQHHPELPALLADLRQEARSSGRA